MSNKHFIAWAAGFFDGEGSISVLHRKRKNNRAGWFALHLCVVNTNRDALLALQDQWGGGIYARPPKPNRRPIFQWHLGDLAAEKFLRDVRPYLRVKAPQATLALEFRSYKQKSPYRFVSREQYDRMGEIAAAIRELNGGRKRVAVVVPDDYVEV